MPWERAAINDTIKDVAKSSGLKMPQVAMPLRHIVTGRTQTPSIDAVLELLGREMVLTARAAPGDRLNACFFFLFDIDPGQWHLEATTQLRGIREPSVALRRRAASRRRCRESTAAFRHLRRAALHVLQPAVIRVASLRSKWCAIRSSR